MSTTKRITKRLLAVVLTVMMLMSMVTIGMTSASAAKVDLAPTGYDIAANTKFYFDNSDAKFTSSTIQLMVGHSGWSQGYKMSKIANTDLYYVNMPAWGGFYDMAVFGVSGTTAWGGEGSTVAHRKNYASEATNVLTVNGNYSGVFELYASGKNTTLEPGYQGTTYASINKTQNVAVQSDISGAFANDAAAATVAINTYKLTANSTASASTASGATASADAARSADVTLSYSDVAEGYTFVGWYEGDTLLSTDATYTYDFDGGVTNDYTARFEYTATEVTSSSADASEDASEDASSSADASSSTGEVESQPATSGPADTDPEEPNGTAFELDWAEASGLYAYAGATDDAIDAEAWQRWLSKSEGRVFYLPASASKTEVIIYNSYSNTVTVNGVKIDAGCYNTVPYVAGTTYTITDAENQKLTIYNTDAEASLFINTDEAKGSVVNDDDAETETALSDLSGIWYDYITAASKNREAKKLGGAVASDDGIVVEQVKKIKGRGNTTWEETKKPFNITFKEAVGIDGMDAAEKWSLLANAKDDSLMRNRIVYDMANEVGMKYACDSRFVDFFVDGRYMGSYQLVQKIEMGEGTVMGDLVEPEVEDVIDDDTGETITYPKENFDFVLELDTQKNADNAGDLTFTTSRGQVMTHKIPDKPAAEQVAFMKAKYQAVENALYGDDLETLETLVDMNDLAKAYLINEISKNVDAGITSCYFVYNADDGIFYLSPVWDYDNALGNMGDTTRQDINGNNLALSQPSGWYASELAHYDSNFTGKHSVFSKACYTTSTTADGKTFADYVDAVWESDFADLIDILEGTVDGNGRLKSIDDYKALLAKSGQWNYENNRINDGWTLKQNWTSDHSSLTMFDYDADANTYTSETKSYNAYDAQDMNQYAGDWAISRLNWLTAQYADADVDVPDGYITVYFQNNWKWSNVKVYAYKDGNPVGAAWPGTAMTLYGNDGTYDIYAATVPDGVNVIFNGTKDDGSGATDQSPDNVAAVDNRCYYMKWSDGNQVGYEDIDVILPPDEEETTVTVPASSDGEEDTTVTTPASSDGEDTTVENTTVTTPVTTAKKVYFQNNWKWTNVSIHMWSADGDLTKWPGAAMTKYGNDGTYDIYVAEVPADAIGIVFTGNKDTDPNALDQSPNIEGDDIVDGRCYYMKWADGNQVGYEPIEVILPPDEEETTVTVPASSDGEDTTVTTPASTPDEEETTVTEPATTVTTPVTTTKTVYFQNNWKWTDVCMYAFDADGAYIGKAWPGDAMTKYGNDGTYDIYVAEVPANAAAIIFNGLKDDGSGNRDQSPNITDIVDGRCYYMKWDNGNTYGYEDIEVILPPDDETTVTVPASSDGEEDTTVTTPASTPDEEATTVTTPVDTGVTVYVVNSVNWDKVQAYAWTNDPAVAWPGEEMTLKGVYGTFNVYEISFDVAYANIIFNNKVGDTGAQTADLELMDGYYYDLKTAKWYENLADVPAENPLATNNYLTGSFNGWNQIANEFMLKEADGTVGYITLTLEANTTYEFKVIRAGAWTSNSTPITDSVTDAVFSSSVQDNATLTTKEAGEYVFAYYDSKLSVTYPEGEDVTDPSDTTPSDTTPSDTTPDDTTPVDVKVALPGSFNGWDQEAFMADNGDGTYTTVLNLEAGAYTFKLKVGDTWYGKNTAFDDNTTDTSDVGWTMKTDEDDATLNATGGTYTFIFNTTTEKLIIEHIPAEVVTPVHEIVFLNDGNHYTHDAPATLDEGAILEFTVEAEEDYVIAAVIADMLELIPDENGVYTYGEVVGYVQIFVVVVEDTSNDTEIIPTTPDDTTPDDTTTPEDTTEAPKTIWTVMFVDEDNNIIAIEKVEDGAGVAAPEAPAKAGYTFEKWSQNTDVVTSDMLVVAKYTKNAVTPPAPATTGKLQIEVSGGTGFTFAIDGGNVRPQGTSYYNAKAPIDKTVTVVANASSDNEFIGWMNNNQLIVSTDLEYTFTTTGDDFLKAMYVTEIEDSSLVIFKNDKANQIVDLQYYVTGDEITLPDPLNNAMFTFKYWTFDGETEITADDIEAKVANGENVTVIPKWEKILVYLNIDVINGSITTGLPVNGKYLRLGKMAVTADAAPAGQKFAYWAQVDADGNEIKKKSYQTYFEFYPAEDMILKAIYVDEFATIDYEILMDINMDTSSESADANPVIVSWEVPDTYKFVQGGALLVNEANYKPETFIKGTTDSNVAKLTPGSALQKPATTIVANKKGVNAGETWVLQIWVTYNDGTKDVTVYSDLAYAVK